MVHWRSSMNVASQGPSLVMQTIVPQTFARSTVLSLKARTSPSDPCPPTGPPAAAPPPPPPPPPPSRASTRSLTGTAIHSRNGAHRVNVTFTLRDFSSLIEQQGKCGSGAVALTGASGGLPIFVAFVFGSSVAARAAGRV